MGIIKREEALRETERVNAAGASMAILGTASYWNAEAILKAASDFAADHNIKDIPVTIAMTFNYSHISQVRRVTYSRQPQLGFITMVDFIKRMTEDDFAPYPNVKVLFHLDHADPAVDEWALTKGTDYLTSAMFDAQVYPLEENIRMTREYVEKYSDKILVEGIMDELSVLGEMKDHTGDNYVEKATMYVKETGIDFLVADLGTEQQATTVGGAKFLSQRAIDLTAALGKRMLVLHGTSSLTNEQMRSLPECGIARVNMWTRTARDTGIYAKEQLDLRSDKFKTGDFDSIESMQYMRDSVEKASQLMYETLDTLQYAKLGSK